MADLTKKILAIITARGGSKGIPGKNIKLLAGKPLIAYSIDEAKKSKYIDQLVVSTDDVDISKVAKEFGAEVIDRPAELAQDGTATAPVLHHVLDFLQESENYKPDVVLLLQPTSPLRTVAHIDEMIEKFMAGDYDSMLSVKFINEPRFEINEKDNLEQVETRENRQKRTPTIIENGALYLTDIDIIKKDLMTGDKIGYYEMDEASSIDIDEPFDFILAEHLINTKK